MQHWLRSFFGPYFFVFGLSASPNAWKYGPEKIRIWTTFTQYKNNKILMFQQLFPLQWFAFKYFIHFTIMESRF